MKVLTCYNLQGTPHLLSLAQNILRLASIKYVPIYIRCGESILFSRLIISGHELLCVFGMLGDKLMILTIVHFYTGSSYNFKYLTYN